MISSSSSTSSDAQLITCLSATLVPNHSTLPTILASDSAVVQARKNKVLEPLLPGLFAWIRSEQAATHVANPLEDDVTGHMTMSKILGKWDMLCSCGDQRYGLNSESSDALRNVIRGALTHLDCCAFMFTIRAQQLFTLVETLHVEHLCLCEYASEHLCRMFRHACAGPTWSAVSFTSHTPM